MKYERADWWQKDKQFYWKQHLLNQAHFFVSMTTRGSINTSFYNAAEKCNNKKRTNERCGSRGNDWTTSEHPRSSLILTTLRIIYLQLILCDCDVLQIFTFFSCVIWTHTHTHTHSPSQPWFILCRGEQRAAMLDRTGPDRTGASQLNDFSCHTTSWNRLEAAWLLRSSSGLPSGCR